VENALCFTAIHALLVTRNSAAWASYWKASGRVEGEVVEDYPHYVATLINKISSSKAKRIFIIHKDRAFFLAGFLAALHAGVPVVLPPSDAEGLLKDLLEPGDGLLTDQEALSHLTPIFILLKHLNTNKECQLKFDIIDRLKASVTFYTSGSTGKPKPIQKSLVQLEEEIETLENMWKSKQKEVLFVSTVSHHHIYGFLFSLLWPICGGYSLRCETFSYWEDILRYCAEETYIVSSPSHLGRFPSFMNDKAGSNIKCVFSSGSLLSFEAAQAAQKFLGQCPIEVYGSTETGGIAHRQQNKREQPWIKFENIELSIGEENRLCVKSPYLPSSLVYQTEDFVSFENDGSFHLGGRADRIVKIEGKRVCLLEMEQRLQNFDHIQHAIVIPLRRVKRDELGSILVLSEQGQEKLLSMGKARFVRELRKSLGLYFDTVALPRRWRFVSELPVTAHGKCSHNVLMDYFGAVK
jgi:acyl-coenzyme A synthetase/AMP-(fatty) acid ligase